MADTPSSILLLRLQSTGSNTNLWGGYLNTALQTLERASKGYQAYTVTGDATLSWSNYSASNDLSVGFAKFNGSPSAAWAITYPSVQTFFGGWNNSGKTGTLKNSGGTGIAVPTGRRSLLYGDATDIGEASPNWLSSYVSSPSNNGDIIVWAVLQAALAAAAIPGATGTVKVDALATAVYLIAAITEGTGIDIADNGDSIGLSVDTTELAEFLALTGTISATLTTGTTAMTDRRRTKITGGTGTLPTMVAGSFVIVEMAPAAGTTVTIARNSQTIDGASADDTFTGIGGVGPVIMYEFVSAGAVTSRLIGGSPF